MTTILLEPSMSLDGYVAGHGGADHITHELERPATQPG
jgi:hypothetical protein